ncbi:MAG: hypothetical protein LBS76_03215 [Mycoplasmataceae bacterium]|nr:hypothetical protein [Mycoplasmataceae bacterium]
MKKLIKTLIPSVLGLGLLTCAVAPTLTSCAKIDFTIKAASTSEINAVGGLLI